MDGDTPEPLDPGVFTRNLDALRPLDPALASQVANLTVPESVALCCGRDGLPTFRIRGEDGRQHWFGGSSAPLVSARALLDVFDPGPGNVLLYGLGSGAEAALLLEQLPPYRGVLVVETEPLTLALALRLRDFSAPLASRRLLLVACAPADLEAALLRTFSSLDGYMFPERMLAWPWLSDGRLQDVQGILHRTAAAVAEHRANTIAFIRRNWTDSPRAAEQSAAGRCNIGRGRLRVAVLGLSPSPTVQDWVADAAEAGTQLGWDTLALTVRSPTDCHILRPIRALEAFRPHWLLAIRCARSDLGGAVPSSLPVVTWSDAVPSASHAAALSVEPPDALAITAERLGDHQAETRLYQNRVTVLPHATLVREDAPLPFDKRTFDVVIMTDLDPIDPLKAGIMLSTQQVLWRRSADIIREQLGNYTADRASDVVAEAERRLRTAIREPRIRDSFVHLVAGRLGPTIVAEEAANALSAAGVRVDVWGCGWRPYGSENVTPHGAIPTGNELLSVLSSARLYLSLSTTGDVGRDVYAAAACGAVLVRRQHPTDTLPGGFVTAFRPGIEAVVFRKTEEMVRVIRDLLARPQEWSALSQSGRERCTREHDMKSRMALLHTMVTALEGGRTGLA